MWIIYVILALLSGVCYRLGGEIQTKLRDMGCAFIALIVYFILGLYGQVWWINSLVYLACFGLLFGALTSYWKPKGTPARWYHWFLHGFVAGLAAFPLLFIGIAWWLILIRAVVLGITMMAVSELTSNVWIEECGRGILLVATVPLLLYGKI